jgi:hypothetical protein
MWRLVLVLAQVQADPGLPPKRPNPILELVDQA